MSSTSKIYTPDDYEQMVNRTFEAITQLARLKGGEYSGDVDRLANFRRNAQALGLENETVWAVYAAKHWDAIMQYVKDLTTGQSRKRMEPITGRVDDLIVYLLLFKAMCEEREL